MTGAPSISRHLRFQIGLVLVGLFGLLGLANQASASGSSLFRYLSYATRDIPPSVAEAKEFAGGKPLDAFLSEWLQSPEHEQRVFRYFNDMFGVTGDIFVADQEFALLRNSSGIYYMDAPGHGDCTLAGSTELGPNEVWWLDAGASPIRICSTTVNSFVTTGTWGQADWRDCFERNATNGLYHPDCGCGPQQVLCWPRELANDVRESIQFEFPRRAVHVYRNSLSWRDLLGGDQFFGDRLLYHVYIYQSRILPGRAIGQPNPTAGDLSRLKALPRSGVSASAGFVAMPDLPHLGAGIAPPLRSGLPTMPGFMRQYNNFRSRIRAMTEKLHCQDVGPVQNTDGIAEFVNPDLSDFDRDHGTKDGCAGCHYAMDNQGSAILGWDQIGFFQFFWDPDELRVRSNSQIGHSFALRGSGPAFLVDSYLSQTDTFHACMAKTAWEDFSGQTWDGLTAERQQALRSASGSGPRALLNAVISAPEMLCPRGVLTADCRTAQTTLTSIDFNADVKPILEQSCSGSTCHSSGSALGASYEFVGTAERFQGINPARLTDGSMPPATSGKSLSDGERTLLLNYLGL